jgi:hypothetical protein
MFWNVGAVLAPVYQSQPPIHCWTMGNSTDSTEQQSLPYGNRSRVCIPTPTRVICTALLAENIARSLATQFATERDGTRREGNGQATQIQPLDV